MRRGGRALHYCTQRPCGRDLDGLEAAPGRPGPPPQKNQTWSCKKNQKSINTTFYTKYKYHSKGIKSKKLIKTGIIPGNWEH